jgi:hypothetical protein
MESEKKYEPSKMFGWWSWYMEGLTDGSGLSGKLFAKLQSGTEYEYYRRDYPTREAAIADLAQAQAALVREQEQEQEEQTVTTTETQTTQGEPIDVSKVRKGDSVLVVRTFSDGYEQTSKGVVAAAELRCVKLRFMGGTVSWVIEPGPNFETRLFLLHSPPRRVEISKDDLILKTPIGTRITLVNSEGGETEGTLQVAGRDGRGFGVYLGPNISSTIRVDLDDIKAIYTEEVQS